MKRRTLRRECAAVFAEFGLAVVGSAEEPLVTDRPDFTEGSSTVGSRVLQLDARAGRRLTERGVDLLVGAGLSWRLGG